MHSRLLIKTGAAAGGVSAGLFGINGGGHGTVIEGPPWIMIFAFILALVALICGTIIAVSYLNNRNR
jgi:hypothetical protein